VGVLLAVKAHRSFGPVTHLVTAYGHTTAQRRVQECYRRGGKTFQNKRHSAVRVFQWRWASEVDWALKVALPVGAAQCPPPHGVFSHWGYFFRCFFENLSGSLLVTRFCVIVGWYNGCLYSECWLTNHWWATPSAALFNECRLARVYWF